MLLDELKFVKQNGYAFDMEEYMQGVHCIGVAVHSGKSEGVAAMGIIAPSYRFSQGKMKHVVSKIVDATMQLSVSLGYDVNKD